MKYLHIFTCIFGLSLECLASRFEIPEGIRAAMPWQTTPSYISQENSSSIIEKHIDFLEGKYEGLKKKKDQNENSHSYTSMKKCIACVVSLFDSNLIPIESLKDIIPDKEDPSTSQNVEARLGDDIVAEAICNNEKYREDGGDNADFLSHFQTHCLCLALRNGLLEKGKITTFVDEKIGCISEVIKREKGLGFKFNEGISKKVAGACADAIQYFCLDKLIMDLTNSVYGNALIEKKFDTTNGHGKGATAMNLLLSNNILRQKLLEKKYKETKEENKFEIDENQDAIVSCGCSAILQSLPYSPVCYDNESIPFDYKNVFGNNKNDILTMLEDALGSNADTIKKDLSEKGAVLPTPLAALKSNELSEKKEIIVYWCKNANSQTSGNRTQGVIGEFSPIHLKEINVEVDGSVKYKPLSFIGFSNNCKNVDLFELCGDSDKYEYTGDEGKKEEGSAGIWLKNNKIIENNEKITKHPENYLFILHKEGNPE